jgi:hypothetical protein
MKFLRPISAIFILALSVLTVSCSEDIEPLGQGVTIPDPETNPGTGGGSFQVDIDGSHYVATTTQVFISGGSIQLSALRAQGDAFGFLLSGTSQATYPANTNLVTYMPAGEEYGYWAVNPQDDTAETGSVNITNIDVTHHTISGTFSFTGYWSDDTDPSPPTPKHFTNGTFTNLPYVTDSPTGDSFLAKVNGVDFSQDDLLAAETTVGPDTFISIGAQNANLDAMTVSVKSSLGTGTYAITGNLASDPVQIAYSNDSGDGMASAGTVAITEKTATRIKGTFSATVVIGTTTYQITAGSFDVAY